MIIQNSVDMRITQDLLAGPKYRSTPPAPVTVTQIRRIFTSKRSSDERKVRCLLLHAVRSPLILHEVESHIQVYAQLPRAPQSISQSPSAPRSGQVVCFEFRDAQGPSESVSAAQAARWFVR